jgi:hypothetical protein
MERHLGQIPKIIHVCWKTKDILEQKNIFVEHTIQKLVNLADGWTPIVSDDSDVEQYLKDNLSFIDYQLIKDRHIVEKVDLWRLFKMFNEGGLYSDIDRLCNVSINSLINENTRIVLPECKDSDFSQDFMCSAPNNLMFLEAAKINIERRRQGVRNIYLLGPQTYFHGITKALTGQMIQTQPPPAVFEELRKLILDTGYIVTYQETPPHNTIMYNPENGKITFDYGEEKIKFYRANSVNHWTNDW